MGGVLGDAIVVVILDSLSALSLLSFSLSLISASLSSGEGRAS